MNSVAIEKDNTEILSYYSFKLQQLSIHGRTISYSKGLIERLSDMLTLMLVKHDITEKDGCYEIIILNGVC